MSSNNAHTDELSQELQISGQGTAAVVRLLDEGSTVPFIARYRKEAIGGLDEQQIIAIRDRLGQLRQRDKRRAAILKSLKEQKKLTDGLQRRISKASTLTELEDIYLPFRPKRKTRAAIAREKGLEPLFNQPLSWSAPHIHSIMQWSDIAQIATEDEPGPRVRKG